MTNEKHCHGAVTNPAMTNESPCPEMAGDHRLSTVMPGFMPGIHVFLHRASAKQDVDGRNKSGHDE